MATFEQHQFQKRTILDTTIRVWQERDRLHIELRDNASGKTLIEWWDDDAREAIEDGFLDVKEAVLGSLERFVRQGGPLHQSVWTLWQERKAA
jgi:hypothetical protein